ncbi:MAG: cyclodeaminase/cyclohydrolase family protein [Candidatus Omnitrophica bacterium]|jgi:formiminotetrahydrofolate cyclodeaminase|nr:cyclodeaminase/cyclohydrolase family protein [Candidatus Omnitrophota bacterium]MDD4012982.1 cyclodeaminase/cyclohydrolase family protein [Candidatus Omnitrophota bacterium]
MKKYMKSEVTAYLRSLSAKTIVPGGGSASALEAALGVALNIMVINFSVKKALPVSRKALAIDKKMSERSLKKLVKLSDDDSKVFSKLMEAISTGKGLRTRYMKAALVPLEVSRECLLASEVSRRLASYGNRNLLTDVGCAANMLRSAFSSARLNVLINLKYMGDKAFACKTAAELDKIGDHIDEAAAEVLALVENSIRP